MKRAPLLVLMLIFSASFCLAQSISEPKLVKKVEATYQDSGRIMVLNGQWYGLEVNLTIPQERTYQDVSLEGTIVEDEEENMFLQFYSPNPPNPFEYTISVNVTSRGRKTTWLPTEYNISASMLNYLTESEKAQSNDPEIRQLAEDITQNASMDFEKIALLAIWVSENVDYDLTYVNKNEDAVTVMKEKKGVCLEHSNLFTALARSLGYPTRYLLGKAYGSYGWLGHSWNEVYLGKWVPVDPTWLEVGYLDATHLEFYRSSHEKLSNEVRANASANSNIEWPSERSFFGKGDDGSGISLLSVEDNDPSEAYSLVSGADTVGYGEQTVVYLEVPGTEYKIMTVNLVSCSSIPEIIYVENPSQYLLTEPGKTSVVKWVLTANTGLKKDVIYTCPLTLNSDLLAEGVVSVKVKEEHEAPELEISLGKPLVSLGDEQSVTVFIEGKAGEVGIISGNFLEKKSPTGSRATFEFTPTRLGENEVVVFSSNGGIARKSFLVKERSALSITDIDAPEEVMAGSQFSVEVTVENKQEPENVKLIGSFGSQTWIKSIKLDGKKTVSFKFNATKHGQQPLKVTLSNGARDEVFVPVQVYAEAVVVMESVRFIQRDGKLYTDISFSATPTVVNLKASIGDKAMSGGNVELTPGNHTLTITWDDVVGNSYSLNRTVDIPSMQPKEDPIMSTVIEIWLLLVLLLIFFVLLGLAAVLMIYKHWFSKRKKKRRRR